METYKQIFENGRLVAFVRQSDKAVIPNNPSNRDYVTIQDELRRGEATILEADPPKPIEDPLISQARAVFLNPLIPASDRLDALAILTGIKPISATPSTPNR